MNAWKNILISFSIISLACAIKNYIIYLLAASPSLWFLFPSFLESHNYYATPDFIDFFYELQRGIIELIHSILENVVKDKYQILSILAISPFVEEIIYRFPLFVIRDKTNNYIFYLFAIIINVIFAHSHNLYGISLLPLFVLGMCCSWIIKTEKVFWPCFAIHSLYNFYSLSFLLFQSIFTGD